MIVSVDMLHKPDPFEPGEYAVKAVEKVPHALFQDIMHDPLQDRLCIAKHIKDMSYDENTKQYGALVLYEAHSQNALIVHSSGYAYCRYAAFVPEFMAAIEQQIRLKAQGIVQDAINASAQSLKNEEPYQPFISWDEIGKDLGFAVSPESGLRGNVQYELEEIAEVKGLSVTESGIEFDVDICGLCLDDFDEPEQQTGGIQL